MDVTLWVVAGLLAAAFLSAGALKLSQPRQALATSGQGWVEDFSAGQVKVIGTLEVLEASRHEVPGTELVLALLKRPGESRAQVGMAAIDSYPCGTVISHLEVTPPRRLKHARAALREPVHGSVPHSLKPSELLELLAGAADHMNAHAIPLDHEAAAWLPALTRALTGKADALPHLLVEPPEPPEPEDRAEAGRAPPHLDPEAASDRPHRKGNARKLAKRRAARAARRRNRR